MQDASLCVVSLLLYHVKSSFTTALSLAACRRVCHCIELHLYIHNIINKCHWDIPTSLDILQYNMMHIYSPLQPCFCCNRWVLFSIYRKLWTTGNDVNYFVFTLLISTTHLFWWFTITSCPQALPSESVIDHKSQTTMHYVLHVLLHTSQTNFYLSAQLSPHTKSWGPLTKIMCTQS